MHTATIKIATTLLTLALATSDNSFAGPQSHTRPASTMPVAPAELNASGIRCAVRDKDTGAPVRGAWVVLRDSSRTQLTCGFTDDKGSVELDRFGEDRFSVACERLRTSEGDLIYIDRKIAIPVTIKDRPPDVIEVPVIVPSPSVLVRVTLRDGAKESPVTAHDGYLRIDPASNNRSGHGWIGQFMKSSKTFVFYDMPPGEYALHMTAPGDRYVTLSPRSVTVRAGIPTRVDLTVQLSASTVQRVRGTIRQAKGAIADAEISLLNKGGQAVRHAVANSDGLFALDDVPGGSYIVAVRAPGYAAATKAVDVPGDELHFTLERSLRLTVDVRHPDGSAAVGLQCAALFQDSDGRAKERTAVSDTHGAAVLDGLPARPLVLCAGTRDHRFAAGAVIHMSEDSRKRLTLLPTTEVPMGVAESTQAGVARVLCVSTDVPLIVLCTGRDGVVKGHLVAGSYSVYVRNIANAEYYRLAGRVDAARVRAGADIDLKKASGANMTLDGVLHDFLAELNVETVPVSDRARAAQTRPALVAETRPAR